MRFLGVGLPLWPPVGPASAQPAAGAAAFLPTGDPKFPPALQEAAGGLPPHPTPRCPLEASRPTSPRGSVGSRGGGARPGSPAPPPPRRPPKCARAPLRPAAPGAAAPGVPVRGPHPRGGGPRTHGAARLRPRARSCQLPGGVGGRREGRAARASKYSPGEIPVSRGRRRQQKCLESVGTVNNLRAFLIILE